MPVVLEDSPVLYWYIMWIYNKINTHDDVESTIRDVPRKMRVPIRLQSQVKKITQDCVKCKIKSKKVSKVKMSTHSESRTVLAPPFHSSMADIAYGFRAIPFKELKVYALVIVWLLFGYCNILSLEGCDTQDVVAAVERHSIRYGVPGYIYNDNKTQSLEKMGVNAKHALPVLQWETLFSKIANTVDNLPITKGDTSNNTNLGYEIITLNRLKLG